ncbi:retron St85 family effector protein [Thalassospira xiamenensis]|uniref:Uncharacterized protein n=1 Tax=Thalassospira xiamenensis TaxID=220697 RepID=A0A285RJZ4_9PROT|nr:retron St85 family effector protein [Thalassospira xiamenensis]SOB94431.1 hypothetical protein SAMN05428964_1011039 [Thalassospira xiamenensis]
MSVSKDDPRVGLIKSIDVSRSRVLLEPHILFICGGPVDISKTCNHSVRNMFMNQSAKFGEKADGIVLAEKFKDWQSGYQSLSDFENDIAALSSLVVIFLESEGALAEFGLFFANSQIRKKLVVILHEEFHLSESFIKLGLISPMEQDNQESVRVYEIDHRKIEEVSKEEVQDIILDLMGYCDDINKTESMRFENRGHSFFAIFQIIDMFLALTKSEIIKFTKDIGFDFTQKEIDSALYILKNFNLINSTKKSSQYFYFANPDQPARVDWQFTGADKRISLQSIKIEVSEYYRSCAIEDVAHKRRMKVIDAVSEGGGDAAI